MAGQRPLGSLRALLPASLVLLATSSAFAQATAADKAAAAAQFDQGVQLMKQKSFSEACPKLEESQRVDPAIGTLLYLAECYERTGRIASAWATFREAASTAENTGQQDRARIAATRAKELEPKLSRLSVELSPEVAKLSGVVVKRGSQRLEPALFGTPLPVDPGDYRIEVSAPGYEPWSTPITVAQGGAASVRVPMLVKGPETPPTTASTPEASDVPGTTPPRDNRVDTTTRVTPVAGMSTQQTIGLILGGAGVVGLGVGGYFGIKAIARNGEAEDHCPSGPSCADQEGEDLTNQAEDAAALSNIAFGAGAVLLAAGTVIYLTGSREEPRAVKLVPLLLPGTATASISGRF